MKRIWTNVIRLCAYNVFKKKKIKRRITQPTQSVRTLRYFQQRFLVVNAILIAQHVITSQHAL